MSGKFALIIANTEYIDPGLAHLTAPGKDAEDFARVLRDKEICAFDTVSVYLNQLSSTIVELIDEFFDQKKPDDLIVLYFSGHGVRDEFGSLYLAVKNTIRSRLRSTAIRSDYIREAMDHSRSKRQILILDCCNSGAFPQGTKAEAGGTMGMVSALQGYGRFVLTASDATQFAWEGDKLIGETQNSLFTHFLVKGLEGEADNGDGKITIDELYDYAYEQISKVTPKQTPTKSSSKQEGEMVLRHITRIEDVKAVPLPAALLDSIENPFSDIRLAAVQQLIKLLNGKNLGLARSAREALERVAEEEDSRQVSRAAVQALESVRQAEQFAHEKANAEIITTEETENLPAQIERESAEDEISLPKAGQGIREKEVPEAFQADQGEAMELASPKEVNEAITERKVLDRKEFTKPYWFRLALIGAAISLLVLARYGATRFLTKIFDVHPTADATLAAVSAVTSQPTLTTVAQTITPEISTNTPPPVPYAVEIKDSKGIEMVLIPAGEFTMGSNNGNPDEKPVNKFNLDAFYIDKFEVSNLHYKLCVDASECTPPQRKSSYTHLYYFGNATFGYYPVIYVDWNMAKTFCEWRGARLPTEAEWEKAARGDDRIYPWGNPIDCSYANYTGSEKNCARDTSRTGSYEEGKSFYGVYDMAGNVWEWVSSLYKPYPYDATDGREDLSADGNRVLRGGAWNVDSSVVRASLRYQSDPTGSDGVIGFRCASPPP